MPKYVWDTSFETGVGPIDEQHKELFAAVNNLMTTCAQGNGKEELKKSLDFLGNYTIKHFYDEEQVLKKYQYPDYEAHRKIHEEFKKEVRDMSVQWIMKGASEELIKEVEEKIGNWLVVHIKGQDLKWGAFLKGKT